MTGSLVPVAAIGVDRFAGGPKLIDIFAN